ncbi:MAG: AbrB family transcriptional regulator [Acidobacteria bacterium]|nr:MAG: AbrB family transcriptional regulator [Acidobacteriota bacterium]
MPKQTLIVSDRGQITLPKKLRDRLAIKPGTALIAEEKDGQLVLRPAMVTAVRIYGDEEIQSWLQEDRITPNERKRILKKATRR